MRHRQQDRYISPWDKSAQASGNVSWELNKARVLLDLGPTFAD